MENVSAKSQLRVPEPVISKHVRISNNDKDADTDLISKKMMKARFFHRDFDPILAHEDTRNYIKDYIFQDTKLKPYRDIVDDDFHHVNDQIVDKLSAEQASRQATANSTVPKPPKDEVDKNKLNMKDLMQAQWLNHELQRMPYFDTNGVSYIPECEKKIKPKGEKVIDEISPQALLEKKWAKEKE